MVTGTSRLITADYRLMMEHADEILVGLNLLMKAAKVEKGYIGIEDNKPAAIKLFEEKTAHCLHRVPGSGFG